MFWPVERQEQKTELRCIAKTLKQCKHHMKPARIDLLRVRQT